MKVMLGSAFVILAFVVVKSNAEANTIKNESVFNYHIKIGIPKAVEIKSQEVALGDQYVNSLRIVGGTFIDISEIPYQVGLLIRLPEDATSVCGGSLISNTRILTAAHCHNDGVNTAQEFTAVLGSNRMFSGGTRIISSDIVVHPNWNPSLLTADIAILRISSVVLSGAIQPITLTSAGSIDFEGQIGIASGYGITSDGASINIQENVSYVNLYIISNAQCKSTYGTQIQSTMICTSGNGVNGPCSGDSGGPLAVDNNGTRILVGVTSFGAEESCVKYPTAYTRVSSYLSWIQITLLQKS